MAAEARLCLPSGEYNVFYIYTARAYIFLKMYVCTVGVCVYRTR